MTGAAVCVPAIRQNLRDLAAQIRSQIEGRETVCARSYEWANLPIEIKMCVLMLAGVEGDLPFIASRKFTELSVRERGAVQVSIRAMAKSLERCAALRLKAG